MEEVVGRIRQACKEIGVFTITGHGIEENSMQEILDVASKFFHLPREKKMKISLMNSQVYRGYVEQGEGQPQGYISIYRPPPPPQETKKSA